MSFKNHLIFYFYFKQQKHWSHYFKNDFEISYLLHLFQILSNAPIIYQEYRYKNLLKNFNINLSNY
jgi:hypothetical protein